MSVTNILFKAKTVASGSTDWVYGYYVQEEDGGVIKHYIYDHPNKWEVVPESVKIYKGTSLSSYTDPVTTIDNIKELQEILVRTTIDYIKEKQLSDVWAVHFGVDGLTSAIEYGEWVPQMDSSISVEGLQEEDGKEFKVRKLIGEYF